MYACLQYNNAGFCYVIPLCYCNHLHIDLNDHKLCFSFHINFVIVTVTKFVNFLDYVSLVISSGSKNCDCSSKIIIYIQATLIFMFFFTLCNTKSLQQLTFGANDYIYVLRRCLYLDLKQ